MSMKRPPHPGGMLLEFCLPGTPNMTIASAAAHYGFGRTELELADICHERAPITAPLAVRVSPRRLAALQKPGWGCRRPMISARAKE